MFANNDFLEFLFDKIEKHYCAKYNEMLKDNNYKKEDLKLLMIEVCSDYQNEFKDFKGDSFFIAIIDSEKQASRIRIRRTRQRWSKKEIEGTNSSLEKESELLTEIFNSDMLDKSFEELYGAKDPTAIFRMRVAELSKWADNNKNLLITFRYFKDKAEYQKDKAIMNDLKYIIVRIIEVYIKEKNRYIEMPESVSNVAFNFSRDKSIDTSNEVKKEINGQENLYYEDVYIIDDETMFKTLIGVETTKDDAISKVLEKRIMNVLNTHDMRIFLHVLSQRDLQFFDTRKIIIPIFDIVKNTMPSTNSHYYNRCKASLHKMAHIRLSVVDKELRGLTFGVFDRVLISKIDGVEIATISVSEDIVNDLVKRRTINLYKGHLNKLEEPASQIIIFNLQAKRISHLSNSDNNKELAIYNMSYFRSILYFTNKRYDRNAVVVEESLQELKDNNLVIKDFKRKGYDFYLEFIPLTEKEKTDLRDRGEDELIYSKNILPSIE